MIRAGAAALLLVLPLAGCGKVGPPRQPGPASAITYPRLYPKPEPPPKPPGIEGTAPVPAPAAR
jgi:hypothetical protein